MTTCKPLFSSVAYFDGIQLKKTGQSTYNYIEKNGFTDASGTSISKWTRSSTMTSNDKIIETCKVGGQSAQVKGDTGTDKHLSQTVNIKGKQGEKFAVGA